MAGPGPVSYTHLDVYKRQLLGLRGLVFKSHGSADAYAFEHALMRAYDAARNRLLDRVTARLAVTPQVAQTAGTPASGAASEQAA